MEAYDGVVLAGGLGRRMGNADKPRLLVGGRPMIAAAISALGNACHAMVIGPAGDFSESPPGGGPVAALAAALPRLTAPVVVVLAADLPFVTMSTVERLVTCAPAVAVDDDGRPQFLLGAYLVAELRQAMPAAAAGTSMRGLVSSLATPPAWISVGVPGGPPPWFDCDTPAQLDAARSWQ